MLPLSEIIIKPGKSKSYLRLILFIYFLTVGLVIYSAVYLLVKLILIFFIIMSLKFDWINKSPDNGIQAIQFIGNEWILSLNNGKDQRYNEVQILIHNILFQLLQFTHSKKKRFIILFHDQVPKSQLRILHLKIAQNNADK